LEIVLSPVDHYDDDAYYCKDGINDAVDEDDPVHEGFHVVLQVGSLFTYSLLEFIGHWYDGGGRGGGSGSDGGWVVGIRSRDGVGEEQDGVLGRIS